MSIVSIKLYTFTNPTSSVLCVYLVHIVWLSVCSTMKSVYIHPPTHLSYPPHPQPTLCTLHFKARHGEKKSG